MLTIKAVVEEEEGGYCAEVPSMPGCITEADDLDELVSNLWEAIEGWTASRRNFDPNAYVASKNVDRLELLLPVSKVA